MRPLLRLAVSGPALGLRMIVRPFLGSSTGWASARGSSTPVTGERQRTALAKRQVQSANDLDRLEL